MIKQLATLLEGKITPDGFEIETDKGIVECSVFGEVRLITPNERVTLGRVSDGMDAIANKFKAIP